MPTQLLPVGPPVVITQNVVYALPNRVVTITTSAACETSVDNVVWTAFTSGSQSSANFLRCTTTGPTVTCKAVGGFTSGGGGGGSLPTAPLGQVLISQGDGVPPVFSNQPVLINPLASAGQRAWRLFTGLGGDFVVQAENDSGVLRAPRIVVDPFVGGLSSFQGGLGAGQGSVSTQFYVVGGFTFAQLPGSGAQNNVGTITNISDSNTNTPGAVIAGGGSFNVLGRWNGTNWKVVSA